MEMHDAQKTTSKKLGFGSIHSIDECPDLQLLAATIGSDVIRVTGASSMTAQGRYKAGETLGRWLVIQVVLLSFQAVDVEPQSGNQWESPLGGNLCLIQPWTTLGGSNCAAGYNEEVHRFKCPDKPRICPLLMENVYAVRIEHL